MGDEIENAVGSETVVAPNSGVTTQTARVSRLAVTAFIIGLIACATCFAGYVFGVIGNVLAISALILIRRDSIRLRGKSLAMAAVALNSLAFFFGVVITAGGAQFVKEVARYVTPIEAIQQNEGEKAKAAFAPAVAAELSAERLAAFNLRVNEQLGNFQGVPTKDLVEFVKRVFSAIDRQSAAMNSLPAETPDRLFALPTDFDKGRALLIVYLDPADRTPEFSLGRIRNLGILKDGTTEIIWLVPLKDKTPQGQAFGGNRAKLPDPVKMSVVESGQASDSAPPPPSQPDSETKNSLPPS